MESTGKKCSFDEMPSLLVIIHERIDTLSALVRGVLYGHSRSEWMDIDQLRDYLPGHLSRATVYDWIRNEGFPHYKRGKSYYFRRLEVDDWLMGKDTILKI